MWAVLMAVAQLAGGDDGARTILAWGAGPRWAIKDENGRWTLHVAGRPATRLVPGAWRDTPAGRRVAGTTDTGRFAMLATHGACGDRVMRSSYFATLTLPDGLVLHGCVLAERTSY